MKSEGVGLKYLSLFSGIEAASCAWEPLGLQPLAFSEIEKFPSAVLAQRYPTVPNLGDVTKHKEWPGLEPDIIVGGSPCQAFSVAGLRRGLEDPRGNLTLTFLSVVDQYRPEWVVWENVPGVLSIDGGRVFGAFLGALAKLGYGFAYRVLDAQFFGVAQRRRRVFVVANARDWRRAAAVLFEPESLRGDSPPSREEGQRAAGSITRRIDRGGVNSEGGDNHLIPAVANPLTARMGNGINTTADEGQTAIVEWPAQIAATLNCAYADKMGLEDQHALNGASLFVEGISPALCSRDFKSSKVEAGGSTLVARPTAVRRLTPTECERLQGFPDDYTAISYRNKPACDGPRYKALGNSMAVPVMRWVGQRIVNVSEREAK